MAADELEAEARVVTLRAERDREAAALRTVESALSRARVEARFRRWPRTFGRGLAWGAVIGVIAGIAAVFRMVGW